MLSVAELHPNQIESVELGSAADAMYAGLTEEATIPRRFEIWWPTGVSSSIGKPSNISQYATYYAGSGCVTPPPYGDQTLYFYQLVWQKLIGWLGLK